MDDKKLYDLSEKIPFTRVTDAVLYEFYNSANNNEIKYFIEKNAASMINSNTDLINGNNYYSQMRATKSFLDFIICKDGGADISIYESVTNYPVVLGTQIPYKRYLYNSDSYFASGGIIRHSSPFPDSKIYFSPSILHQIHKIGKNNILDLDFIRSKAGLDLETHYPSLASKDLAKVRI
jgi:hypothetical protein